MVFFGRCAPDRWTELLADCVVTIIEIGEQGSIPGVNAFHVAENTVRTLHRKVR
jgi:hypothetical protein